MSIWELQIVPDDARLLCALGDLTRDPQHYVDAWERSGHRNARAKRSLAQGQMSKSNFQQVRTRLPDRLMLQQPGIASMALMLAHVV